MQTYLTENKLNFLFKNQIWHIGGMIFLIYVGNQITDFKNTSNIFLGITTKIWYLLAMMTPLLHQTYVWLCWRSELCWRIISNTIGFKVYAIGFFIGFILRFVFSIGLCIVDYGSLYSPGLIVWIVAILIFIPGSYTMYSVKKYFGFLRACGADHFDQKYKYISFEKRGIFKYFSNSMYLFAMAIFLCFAISSGSKAGFIFAVYSYVGTWLHYFCTEKEDYKIIYGNN